MFDEFLKNNKIDFLKLGIDSVTAKKIEQFMNMSYNCYLNSKEVINDIVVSKKIGNYVDDFCKKERLQISQDYKNLNFSGFLLAFSIELNLKVLYILEQYKSIKNNIENLNKSDEEICELCFRKVRNETSGHIKTKNQYSFSELNIPKKNNGHYLISLLNNLSNQNTKNLIRYETMLAPLKKYYNKNKLPDNQEYIEFPDIILMLKNFNYEDTIKFINQKYVELSDSFEKMRYSENEGDISNNNFLAAFSLATNMALCDVLRRDIYNNQNKNDHVVSKESYLDKYIFNNLDNEYYKKIYKLKSCNPFDYQIIVSKFTLKELEGIINNFKELKKLQENEIDLYTFLNYYIYFKKHIENDKFIYNEKTIPNISKLFETIRKIDDISQADNQFINWFNSINIDDLTEEELSLIENIDPIYFYNSLSYIDKIIWQKCKEKNIKFKIYYKCYLLSIDFVLNNFSNYFVNKPVGLDYLEYFYKLNFDKNLIEQLLNLSIANSIKFKEIFAIYKKNGLESVQNIINLSKKNKISTKYMNIFYNKYSNNEILKLKKLSKKLEASLEYALKIYENCNEYEISSIMYLSRKFKQSFESMESVCMHFTEAEIKKSIQLQSELKIPFNELIWFMKNYTKDELKKIKELSNKSKISSEELCSYFVEYNTIERSKLFDLLKDEIDFLIQLINYYSPISFEELKEYLRIYKKYNVALACIVFDYNNNESEFKQIIDIANEFNTGFILSPEIYNKYNKSELQEIFDKSKTTNIPFTKIVELFDYQSKEQILDKLKVLEDKSIKYTSKMQLLSLEELIKNCDLIDQSKDYIFYKKPESIMQIKEICKSKSIKFKPEFLYFELQDLIDNIEAIDFVLDSNKTQINCFDVDFILSKAKKYKNKINDYISDMVLTLYKKGMKPEEIINEILNVNKNIDKQKSYEKKKM